MESAIKHTLVFPFYIGVNLVCVITPVTLSGNAITGNSGMDATYGLQFIIVLLVIMTAAFCWRIRQENRYVAPQPPASARSVVYFMVYVLLTPSVLQPNRSAAYLLILGLLYLGQLLYDRLEAFMGGYMLLAGKMLRYYLRRKKRRSVERIPVSDKSPVLIVDVDAWYVLTEDEIGRIENAFPNHFIVNNLHALAPKDYNLVEVIFGAPPQSILKKFTSLRWIHLPSSGMNGYDRRELYSASPVITSSAGVYGESISEYALGLILMLAKRLDSAVIANKCGYGHEIQHANLDLRNSTILILGLGNIGKCLAVRCKALGAEVIGIRRRGGDCCPEVDRCYTMEQLDEVIGEADVIVLALPESRETDNIVNLTRIEQMKQGVYLVNLGRGNAVNQRDLRKALRRGLIGGAALDVSKPDPLLPYSSLFKYRNLVLTLHHSSISDSNGHRAVMVFLTTREKVCLKRA